MGRQNKVNFLFKGLSKKTEYTVAEIVDSAQKLGTLDVIYPNIAEKDQVRKARQLVQSHINSRGIQSSGMRKDLKIYWGGLFSNNEEEHAEWVNRIQKEALSGFKRWSRIWIPIAVVSLFVTSGAIWVLMAWNKPPDMRIQQLAKARDVAGLRALASENRQLTPVLNESEAAELKANVIAATGLDLDLKLDVDHFVDYPLHQAIAREVSRLETEIHLISPERLAAVFPFLKNPIWVFADETGRLFSVSLGTNVLVEGNIGHIYQVNSFTLSYRLQNGEDRVLERPLYTYFGQNQEHRGTHSVILKQPEGNLSHLIDFLGRELNVEVDNRALYEGQISGFFPEVTDLVDLLPEFKEAGIHFDGHTILVKQEPEIKLLLGFYDTKIYAYKDLNKLFAYFDELTQQTINWQPFSGERYWYNGQSFYHVCRQAGLLATINGNEITLIR